jgi:hypothetical protein
MNTTAKLSPADLSRFTGTEKYYRHALNPSILLTDGARYVADEGGAHWLLDVIALAQCADKQFGRQPFQVWRMTVRPDRSATITVEDGNNNSLFSRTLQFTDFPAPGITLWFSNNVIYLPSEH